MSEELSRIEAELEHALDVHRNVHSDYGSALAIKAAIDLLLRMGVKPQLTIPLASILGQYSDRYSSENLKPHTESLQWARAAGCLDVLRSNGMPLKEAAQRVSRNIKGRISADQIIEFRKNIRRGRARQDAIDAFQHTVQLFKKDDPATRERIINDILRNLWLPAKKE